MNILLKPCYFLCLLFASFFLAFSVYAAPQSYLAMQDGVTDTVGLLNKQEFDSINQKIISLEQQQGPQLAVLIISTTRPLTIEQYANDVFNQWRLGRLNIDDGVLLVVALNDRAVRIEVGYGLEGQIPDLFASQVINDYIIPHFKAEMYSEGIELAVDALIARVNQEPLPSVDKTPFFIAKQSEPIGLIDLIAGILIGGGIFLWVCGIYRLIKSYPLKAGIPILLITYLTWYFGGFDMSKWNGLRFGEEFLSTDLPRWVQILFLQIFPCWFAVVMIFTCFIVACFLFLGLLGGLIMILNRWIKSTKLKQAIGFSSVFGIVIFFIAYSISNSLILGLIMGLIIALLIGIGVYTGKVTVNAGSGSSNRGHSSGGYSGRSSSSSSRSSGGGGRSGGGGASGRW